MSATIKVGVFMFVILLAAAVLIIKIEDISIGDRSGMRRVEAEFDSVAGLDVKSAVRVAGIRVGRVDSIRLEGRRARIVLLLDNADLVLREGAYAQIINMGMLGDKYLELFPGAGDATPLGAESVLPGRVPTGLDQITDLVADIAVDVKDVTGSLRGALGGLEGEARLVEILENVRVSTAEIRALLSTNRGGVERTVSNFENFSADLARELPRIVEKLTNLADKLTTVVDENRENVRGGLEDVRVLAQKFQTTADNINEISGRIAAGEGTIGKLVASDEAHDQLTGTLGAITEGAQTLTETLGMVGRTRFDLGFEGQFLAEVEKTRSALSLDIRPLGTDQFYFVELVSLPDGLRRSQTEVITTVLPDGTTETVTIENVRFDDDRFGVTAMFGLQRDRLSLRAGLIESEGGVAADLDLLDSRRLNLSLEAYDFGREIGDEENQVHLRLTGRWRLNDNVFLTAGWDDPISSDQRSLFLGGGLTWTDEHLKYFLGSIPVN